MLINYQHQHIFFMEEFAVSLLLVRVYSVVSNSLCGSPRTVALQASILEWVAISPFRSHYYLDLEIFTFFLFLGDSWFVNLLPAQPWLYLTLQTTPQGRDSCSLEVYGWNDPTMSQLVGFRARNWAHSRLWLQDKCFLLFTFIFGFSGVWLHCCFLPGPTGRGLHLTNCDAGTAVWLQSWGRWLWVQERWQR